MFVGELDNTFERVLEDIMLNSVSTFIIERDVHCITANCEYVATATYMRKPLEKTECDGSNQSLIIMQCIVVEIDGIKLPIFSNGDIFLSVCMNEVGITHPIHINNATARRFFRFIIGTYRSKGLPEWYTTI